jgi:hypothetical protein
VPPSVIARQQSVQGLDQVVVGAGAELHDHHACRGMRHEHGEEPVIGVDIGQEARAFCGQVEEPRMAPRLDADLAMLHGAQGAA